MQERGKRVTTGVSREGKRGARVRIEKGAAPLFSVTSAPLIQVDVRIPLVAYFGTFFPKRNVGDADIRHVYWGFFSTSLKKAVRTQSDWKRSPTCCETLTSTPPPTPKNGTHSLDFMLGPSRLVAIPA